MGKPNRKSKRITLKQKYKVEKKVREHRRKVRRQAKKNPNKRTRLKKDPGIPNLYPFKQDLLNQMRKEHEQEAELALKQKAARVALRKKSKQQQLEDLMARASRQEATFNAKQILAQDARSNLSIMKESSRKAYYKEFKKVVANADVILEVLDARDPLGCRCPAVERAILAAHPEKHIVLVLNKVDLVPKPVVEAWLKYLRNDFPCVAFKASTQSQANRLKQAPVSVEMASESALRTTECLGAGTMLTLLKKYCLINSSSKGNITVGIIGYPNVGKSSIINSLKRHRAAGVGSTPGLTTKAQFFKLDRNVTLMDCPGIVFSSGKQSDAEIILRNCVKLDSLEDPITPVELLLRRCHKKALMELYEIPAWKDCTHFLDLIAKRIGRLKAGGVGIQAAAAVAVLQDWNMGKIRFYTVPPERTDTSTGSSIVSVMAPAFNFDDVLMQEKQEVMECLPGMDADDCVPMQNSTVDDAMFLNGMAGAGMDVSENDSDEDLGGEDYQLIDEGKAEAQRDELDEDEEVMRIRKRKEAQARRRNSKAEAEDDAPDKEDEARNPMTNKQLRKLAKARAKAKARKRRPKAQLSKHGDEEVDVDEVEDEAMGAADDAYDWSTDFFAGGGGPHLGRAPQGMEEEDGFVFDV